MHSILLLIVLLLLILILILLLILILPLILLLGGAAVYRCDNRRILIAALAAEGWRLPKLRR